MSRSFISEDDIERALLEELKKPEYKYDSFITCDSSPNSQTKLPDGTGRENKKQCVLPAVLKESIYRLNPQIDHELLDVEIKKLCSYFGESVLSDTNYNLYNKIRNTIKVSFKKDGKDDFDFIKLIDFDNPDNNTFTVVNQMWIEGKYYFRRPDVLIFINGMPLVFIELKNSTVKVEQAYNKNLKDYLKDVPNLFAFNQICVLCNGYETRIGAYNASYDFFFEWLREKEGDSIDRKELEENPISILYFIRSLLKKEALLDYIENFILFENKKTKIIAKNHQFYGVNNLMNNFYKRDELGGKLGVFWHTQGSGKSYSMAFFARKVNKKVTGNFTFLIVTDREELDTQIHKTFLRTEIIGLNDQTQPKDSEQLRNFLGSNKPFIFTLIHKFRYEKTEKYPILSTRNDIIVLVDEAHRTQYKDLAENMRRGLPNAKYVAFTGTPLLGSKRLTNSWFGDYVSTYNFAQSVEDGSTVPLFYSRRVPEVWLDNDFLDDDILDVIDSEELNDAEAAVVENSESRVVEIIKRKDRLDKIAKDIAHHFPRRGFLGKGLVVSIDKFTAVYMYDRVQYYWEKEKQAFIHERNHESDPEKRAKITNILNFMNSVEMAVVISDGGDDEKFAEHGLNIQQHRTRMAYVDPDGNDIEDQFKDPNNKLQLVFVCSMWLTGFDVKSLSTLYLDKPMKSHTLMQAIARANRVFPNKPCGIIVDYVNVFKFMKQALKDYAVDDESEEFPVKEIDKLLANLDSVIDEIDAFLEGLGVSLDKIIDEAETFDQLEMLRKAYNLIIAKEDTKNRFKVLSNTMINLYEASKPEIFELDWENDKFAPINYIAGLFYRLIDDEKVERARKKIRGILDNSVSSASPMDIDNYEIKGTKVINLSKLDVSDVRRCIREAPYKAIETEDIRAFIEKALQEMINKNRGRIKFSERYKGIIDRYNAGGMENEDYYEQLCQLMEELKKEAERPGVEGLSEEELEIYDLLISGKKLTQTEEQKVKLAAKNLFLKLTKEKENLLVVDWFKDDRTTARVRTAISDCLDADLPESYDKELFNSKTDSILAMLIDRAVQGLLFV